MLCAPAPLSRVAPLAARVLVAGAALHAAAMGLLGCSGPLPQPVYAPHPPSALVEVPFPPPPARAEFVPDQPRDDAVWIDGEWLWQGRVWAWKYGRWVVPPPGALFSPWTTARNSEATLFVASGVWRDARGRAVPPPKPLALGRATQEDVVEDEGILEDTGENVAPGGPRR